MRNSSGRRMMSEEGEGPSPVRELLRQLYIDTGEHSVDQDLIRHEIVLVIHGILLHHYTIYHYLNMSVYLFVGFKPLISIFLRQYPLCGHESLYFILLVSDESILIRFIEPIVPLIEFSK